MSEHHDTYLIHLNDFSVSAYLTCIPVLGDACRIVCPHTDIASPGARNGFTLSRYFTVCVHQRPNTGSRNSGTVNFVMKPMHCQTFHNVNVSSDVHSLTSRDITCTKIPGGSMSCRYEVLEYSLWGVSHYTCCNVSSAAHVRAQHCAALNADRAENCQERAHTAAQDDRW